MAKIYLFVLSVLLLTADANSQSAFISSDNCYARDFCTSGDSVWMMAQTVNYPASSKPVSTGFYLYLLVTNKLSKNVNFTSKDTIFQALKIEYEGAHLKLYCSYVLPMQKLKGILVMTFSSLNLSLLETHTYPLDHFRNFTQIFPFEFDVVKSGNLLIGAFSVDTTDVTALSPVCFPILFRLNLLTDSIIYKPLPHVDHIESLELLKISDSTFTFYTSSASSKILTFNSSLHISDSSDFLYLEPFLTSPFVSYVSAIKLDNSCYIASSTDSFVHPAATKRRATILVTGLNNVPNKRISFYDPLLETTDNHFGYSTGEGGKSIAYNNNRFFFMYHSYNHFKGVTGNNTLYLKIMDPDLNLITTKTFHFPNKQIRAGRIDCNNEGCYLMCNILDTANLATYNPYLIRIGYDSLLMNIEKTGIDLHERLSFYPNPFDETVHIDNPTQKTLTLTIYSFFGELIKVQHLTPGGNSINLSAFPNFKLFFYTIRNENGEMISSGKLVAH